MLIASYLYARGYECGNGLQEGMRFGVLIGLLMVGYAANVNYAIMNIGKRMAVYYALASLVEWVVIGMVIGLFTGRGRCLWRKSARPRPGYDCRV